MSQKASDTQQLIDDINQRILYDKHFFSHPSTKKRYDFLKFSFSAFTVTTS